MFCCSSIKFPLTFKLLAGWFPTMLSESSPHQIISLVFCMILDILNLQMHTHHWYLFFEGSKSKDEVIKAAGGVSAWLSLADKSFGSLGTS